MKQQVDAQPQRPMLLTVKEAAAELRISKPTCYRLIAGGIIPSIRLPSSNPDAEGEIRVPADLLHAWIAKQCGEWAELAQWDPARSMAIVLQEAI
jgi:excisionase family DNA binding protein